MVDRTPPPPPPVSLRPLATSSVAPRHRMLLHFFTQFLSFFKYFFSYYAHSTIRYSYCSWLSPSCIVPFYQSCEKVNSTQQTISPPPSLSSHPLIVSLRAFCSSGLGHHCKVLHFFLPFLFFFFLKLFLIFLVMYIPSYLTLTVPNYHVMYRVIFGSGISNHGHNVYDVPSLGYRAVVITRLYLHDRFFLDT